MLIVTRTGAEIEIAQPNGTRTTLAVDRMRSAQIAACRNEAGKVTVALVIEDVVNGSTRIEGSFATLCAIQERICEVMAETALSEPAAVQSGILDDLIEDWYGATTSP
jgi:hypothetical protein